MPGGRGWELAREVGVAGVMRGCGPGMGAWRRSVSIMVAWRRGRVSMDRGEGR